MRGIAGQSLELASNWVYAMHSQLTIINGSAIAFVEQLLKEAGIKKASDIHIEPRQNDYRIRLRIDGLLYELANISTSLALQIITRLKLLANLNIAEKRLPQDGRIVHPQFNIDIRISTCPFLHGEKIVLRILDTRKSNISIHTLGMTEEQVELYQKSLNKSQGLILVTGPTGSGKTTTLYAALHYLNTNEKNISSVEDPVEIELRGINQVNVNPLIGLDFPSALKHLLRQDPDIIMIGEIRDRETAIIALQAAQTGHLVLSTLHTNSAYEAIARLNGMNIPSWLTHTASLIIGQRLLRKRCQFCEDGCDQCIKGYKDRVGIFEFLSPPFHIKTTQNQLRNEGLKKVSNGITNLSELTRVLSL